MFLAAEIMEVRQLIRVATYMYINILPAFLNFWMAAILPEALERTFFLTDKGARSRAGGYFYTMFYSGMILGALAWPKIIDFISKKNAILLGLIFQAVFNSGMGRTRDIMTVYFFRFMTGIFQNLNTVGKDFVFEFAKPSYRQYSYTLKTFSTFLGSLVGPFLGNYFYFKEHKDFGRCLDYVTELYLVGVALFVLVFYVDRYKAVASGDGTDEEETIGLAQSSTVNNPNDQRIRQKGIFEVLRFCCEHANLRKIVTVYAITGGVYKTINYITVFFLETSWEDNGLEISSTTLTWISLIAFIPASLIILLSPMVVPKHITYQRYIRFFIGLVIVMLILLPAIRDLLPSKGHRHIWVIYLVQGTLYCFAPKIYSPFINYYVNKKVDRQSRTAMNAITFISSNLAGSVIIGLIGPLFALTMFDNMFEGYRTYSKYASFVLLDILLIIAYRFMNLSSEESY